MKKKKAYKLFIVENSGNVRLYHGKEYITDIEAERDAMMFRTDHDLIVLPVFVVERITLPNDFE